MDMNWLNKKYAGQTEMIKKYNTMIDSNAFTCSCSGFFVPFKIARHAAELALQLSPYCGTSGRQTFK